MKIRELKHLINSIEKQYDDLDILLDLPIPKITNNISIKIKKCYYQALLWGNGDVFDIESEVEENSECPNAYFAILKIN